jgi:hypothetical protein
MLEEFGDDRLIKIQRRWQLYQHRTSLFGEAFDLIKELHERFANVCETAFVRNRSRELHREPEFWRRTVAPFGVSRRLVRSMERRIDLCTAQTT